jgi:hypothetical protein
VEAPFVEVLDLTLSSALVMLKKVERPWFLMVLLNMVNSIASGFYAIWLSKVSSKRS